MFTASVIIGGFPTYKMSQVEEYLASSGEMERLSKHLHDRLEQSGWFDQVSTLAAAELSASDNPNFESITQQVTARAMGR